MNVRKLGGILRRRKSFSMFKNTPSLSERPNDRQYIVLQSPISTSMKAEIRYYELGDLIVFSIATEGLLTLYEPIGFMEDFVNVSTITPKDSHKKYQVFAVYDGHGGRDPKTGIKKGGQEVAEWCVENLPKMIKYVMEKHSNNNIQDNLIQSFEKADKVMIDKFAENVGATAIVVLRDTADGSLYFVNLGDSRAVVCSKGKVGFETEDYDWANQKELDRIGINKDNQSYVIKTKSGEKKKFILNGKHLNGEKWNLATSRSFGDKHFKLDSEKPPVLAIPIINKITIDQDMKLILVASDGIWENGRGLETDHFISKFIQIAKTQRLTRENVNDCLKNTCIEFVKWCMIDHLKLDFKNYGDNIALIAIGVLDKRRDKYQWFNEIQGWAGKYTEQHSLLRGINDTIQEESQEDEYGSDSSSCKFDFTDMK